MRGSGKGLGIIKELGFNDFVLRPATEAENHEFGIKTVAEFGIK